MDDAEIPVLQPPRELTLATLPIFERVTQDYREGETRDLVLDLAGVHTISSAGFGHLVQVGRRLGERGGVLVLACGSRRVVRLLAMLGLDAVIPHFPTVKAARAWLRERGAGTPGRDARTS
ncbi:MAG: STAS domain-containing protein [Planctomycetota bacterium]